MRYYVKCIYSSNSSLRCAWLLFYYPVMQLHMQDSGYSLTCHKYFGLLLNRLWRHIKMIWAPSSEFVSSSIPSWQISTAHVQPFRGARDLVFCLKVPLYSVLVWASSEGSGETARMRRLAWTFAARIGDKYQIRLTRPILRGCTYMQYGVSRLYSVLPQILWCRD